MTELEYLQKYEPVLRFAKSERFFPTKVEHYLEYCRIFPSGPQGAVDLLPFINEPLKATIGKLKNWQYFLRFVNNPFNASDTWIGWGILSAIAIAAGWFLERRPGIEVAIALSLLAALIVFMQASPIRLRIIPAVFAASLFITLESLPVWFFLKPHTLVSARVEYLVLLPIYLLALFYLSVRAMKFIFDRIIPEAPGVIMDMLSSANERVAQEAYSQYDKILEKDSQPVYYGRMVEETDKQGDHWRILQYHFFYVFNDWRLAANGMNHHEGDWEMVAVYLKNNQPYAVLYSQHRAGAMELWQDTPKVRDGSGETTHPIIYVALGSHANYGRPQIIQSPELYKEGYIKLFAYWLDGLIRFIFLLVNPDEKARQTALKEIASKDYHSVYDAEEAFLKLHDEKDRYLVSLPMEIATGDGLRIGAEGDLRREWAGHSSSYLKRVMSNRKATHPREHIWHPIFLSEKHTWLDYQGLWGVKSTLSNESGPPGPKWDRPQKGQPPKPRTRWERPLEWLAEMEELEQQKKATHFA